MTEKHYNIGYLEDTATVMQGIKMHSYQPFAKLTEGIIADLGCGTGFDLLNMAKMNPKASFVGIDHDPAMIEKANASKDAVPNVRFDNAEVIPLPWKDNSVSGIRAERLLQHMAKPEELFKEVKRVLTEKHPFVIVETDWNSISFYNSDIIIEKKIHDYLLEKKVVNGTAAKTLTENLSKHGFKNIHLNVFPIVSYSFEEACKYLWIDKIIQEMKQIDELTDIEHDHFLGDLRAANSNGYFACSLNIVVCSATK